jgi:SPP1 family phage portal protein
MKTLAQIFIADRSIDDIVEDLKYYKKNMMSIPSWKDVEREYEPRLHEIIVNKEKYPDKPIIETKKDGNGKEYDEVVRREPITRIAIGLQKLAAKRMSEFLFAIPVKSIAEDTGGIKKDQLKAVTKVLKKNKWNSANKDRANIISSECECATLWYAVESPNKNYGFQSKFKLKKLVMSPSQGDILYPTFDDKGDLIAFSREYIKKDSSGKDTTVFETWTDSEHIVYQNDGGGWSEIFTSTDEDGTGIRDLITIDKIPVIYTFRSKGPIWRDADCGKVHEMEVLISRNGDTIAYHSAPVLLIKGSLQGAPTKGESNKVFYTTDAAGDAKYVSWDQAPESVKFQFESLIRMFFQELQLPDISFESLKGIGAMSSLAIAMLFSDAHLKCGDESSIYEEMLEREYNVIKAFLAQMNTSWKSSIDELEIEPEITPFTINDEKTMIEMFVTATGNKPIMAQKTAIKKAGLVDDADAELKQINDESIADLANPSL